MTLFAATMVFLVIPLSVASLLTLALCVARAEEGYQDEDGFHPGRRHAPLALPRDVPDSSRE